MFGWFKKRRAAQRQSEQAVAKGRALHRPGETTGQFLARTAESIQIESDAEVDPDAARELVRRYWQERSQRGV